MRVILIHQHDPSLHYAAGIGTFINGFIKYAPAEFEVSLVGVTADPQARPVGCWQRLNIEGRPFDFLPVVAAHPNVRGRIPLSLQFTWALARARHRLNMQGAVLTFHRIEPSLAFRNLATPRILFLHVHPQDLRNPKTEVVWGRFPWLYFRLERRLINAMTRIFIVREDAVGFYRARYPALADRVAFLPTWVDEEVFVSLPEAQRQHQRQQLVRTQGFDPADRVLLFVGRFEGQKDPLFLLEAFRQLNGLVGQTRLVMIGEGSLEPDIQAFLAAQGLTRLVRLIGPQPQPEIARWMNSADCLALSSAYEGMPMVVLEALQCGLPVVTTDVGEARRVIQGSAVGRLVSERTPQALGGAVAEVLRQRPDRAACQRQVAPYTAKRVLAQVYDAYRELHDHAAH